jgi:iduronate 2-sulfatase
MNVRWSLGGVVCAAVAVAVGFSSACGAADGPKRNVLFIAVDDLRPELGCYGNGLVKTPNIDRLAGRGVLFRSAYCQEAICGATRASLLTGLRPDHTRVYDCDIYFRDTIPDVVTLPQYFRQNGYATAYAGKVFHGNLRDEERSWSEPAVQGKFDRPLGLLGYQLPENQKLVRQRQQEMRRQFPGERLAGLDCGPATECAEVPDDAYQDGRIAEAGVLTLRKLAKDRRPFFLAVGFLKPHLPFVAPRKYWDLYDEAKIPLAENPLAPRGATSLGLHSSFELRTRADMPKDGPIGDATARHLIHGYMACTSYVDAQLGKVLAELDALGLRKDTIVVLWGDHGWHLGDHGIWGKATNYEVATRVPLIVRAPHAAGNGRAAAGLVEYVDLYPTLCQLAGLAVPGSLDGRSVEPLLENPGAPGKAAAFSQFPAPALREWAGEPMTPAMRKTFFGPLIAKAEERLAEEFGDEWSPQRFNLNVMGYAMRTPRYRLVRWVDVRKPTKSLAAELYDYEVDPHETRNVAGEKGNAELVRRLTDQMNAAMGWAGAE